MYTRCPTCLTCFRVTEQHLSIADGQVRCGQCQLVFNAPEHAIDDLPIAQLSSEVSQTEPVIESSEELPVTDNIAVDETHNLDDANSSIENEVQAENITASEDSLEAFKSENTDFEKITTAQEKVAVEAINNDELLSSKTEDLSKLEEQPQITVTDDNDTAEITDKKNQLSLNITNPDARHETEDQTEEFDFELDLDKTTDTDNDVIKLVNEPDEKEDIAAQVVSPQIESIEEFQSEKIKSNEENINKKESFEVIESVEIKDDAIDAEENINEDIPLQLRDDLERIKQLTPRRTRPLLNLFFLVILIVFSFTQLAYFRAFELTYALPSATPLIKAFCEKITCRYSGPVDTKHIQLLNRDVRIHPKEKNALLISASMINNAYFAQPYPNIKIRLSDISGNVIAERIFNAKTYLKKINNPFLLMKSKVPVHINFEVVDPGKDAVNFEFNFL